jgi:hypothetical protein
LGDLATTSRQQDIIEINQTDTWHCLPYLVPATENMTICPRHHPHPERK